MTIGDYYYIKLYDFQQTIVQKFLDQTVTFPVGTPWRDSTGAFPPITITPVTYPAITVPTAEEIARQAQQDASSAVFWSYVAAAGVNFPEWPEEEKLPVNWREEGF